MTNNNDIGSGEKLIWTNAELEQGSDAWLKFRSFGLGGSEVASLMHENPFENLVVTWRKKVHPEEFDNTELEAHVRRGNELEPKARALYEKFFRNPVEQLCLLHPQHRWMRTSLDGITLDREAVLEIKCPKSRDNHDKQIKIAPGGRPFDGCFSVDGQVHTNALLGIPAYRYAQMQHQLAVCNAQFGTREVHYYSYVDDRTWAQIVVPIDEAYIAELIRREEIFYHQFVLPGVEPPPYLFREEEPLCRRAAFA